MNIRQVLKAFTALRQLTDDESALLETLRGMSETERESLVVALSPEKTATKRASRKSSRGASKSARASGMAAAIKNNLQRREPTVGGFADDADMLHCSDCGAGSDDNVHHKRSDENYHPFVSTAQPARGKSSTNGGATSGTVSSETEREDVSNVHHAGG